MAYGIIKVDNITFDNGGSDQNVTVSGLYRATTSGVTVSGTIAATTVSGVTVIGSTTVSGATVTGTTANFTSGNFSNLISAAATMSGALIMANQQQVRFREAVGNGVNHIALQAPAIVSADQTITLPDQTGTVVTTGDNGSVTSTMILDGTIVNADINASAAIVDTKLATIATAGKVSNSATTAASANTASAIVARDASGNFAAGDITISDRIIHDGDTNTAIRFPAADTVTVETAGSERVRVDSSGRLLVGTSSALTAAVINPFFQQAGTALSQVTSLNVGFNSDTTTAGAIYLGKSKNSTIAIGSIVASGDRLGVLRFIGDDGSALASAAEIAAFVDGTPGLNDMPGRLVFSTTADGASTLTEAMRINSEQELLIGYTADNGAYKLQVNSQIFATSATVATSDGRYKENVATLNGCIDLVNALRPVSFDWKPQQDITRIDEDGNSVLVREGHNFPDGKQVGFIAQEVQEVLADKPWLGSVIKQNVRPAIEDADGNELAPEEEFFGIAEGNLTAVLTAALQEAITKIDALEARVAALEA
jgi:hypothetical protein